MTTAAEISPALDLHDFRTKARKLALARQEAREQREKWALTEAEAEHNFRKTVAVVFARERRNGEGVGAAEIIARGEAAGHAKVRDDAHAMVRSCELRIAEVEANRSMLRSDFESGAREGLS